MHRGKYLNEEISNQDGTSEAVTNLDEGVEISLQKRLRRQIKERLSKTIFRLALKQ